MMEKKEGEAALAAFPSLFVECGSCEKVSLPLGHQELAPDELKVVAV
jgi:hypothetical protein